MRFRSFLIAVSLVALSAPVGAQAAQSSAEARDAGWSAWAERVVAISTRDNQRLAEILPKLNAAMKSLATPEQANAQLPVIQAIGASMRADLARNKAELISLRASAPPPPTGFSVTPEQVVSDALKQNESASALLDSMDSLMKAAVVRDVATIQKMLPRMAASSFLIVDNQAAIYRGRRDAMAGSPVDFAAMGLMATLYGAMGDLLRISIHSAPPMLADTSIPRANLTVHAGNARSLAEAGQSELAERRAILAEASKAKLSAADAAMLARAKGLTEGYASVFDFGMELAGEIKVIDAELGKGAPTPAAARQGLSRIVAMEQKAQQLFNRMMEAATGN